LEIVEYTLAEMKENHKAAYRENSPWPLNVIKGREKIKESGRA
jgi:hypothetical protein